MDSSNCANKALAKLNDIVKSLGDSKVLNIIINAPLSHLSVHQELIAFLDAMGTIEERSKVKLNKVIFMGPAAAVAAQDYGDKSNELYAQYIEAAKKAQATLLVCGQAVKAYGVGTDKELAPSFSLTGYMEIIATLKSKKEQVLQW